MSQRLQLLESTAHQQMKKHSLVNKQTAQLVAISWIRWTKIKLQCPQPKFSEP